LPKRLGYNPVDVDSVVLEEIGDRQNIDFKNRLLKYKSKSSKINKVKIFYILAGNF
jgi:hypothetical protein